MNKTPSAELSTIKSSWVSVLIMTRNEALHIRRCIQSAKLLSPHVFVIDSQSTDGTAQIAESMGATVICGDFLDFHTKLNWCLDNISFKTPWIIRLDADEIFTQELLTYLYSAIEYVDRAVNGFYLRRQIWFMGKWIKHGGMYPTFSMRLWRRNTVRCEARLLDEHMILLSGTAATLQLDIIDNPLYSLTKWIEKHNIYSVLESDSATNVQYDMDRLIRPSLFGTSPQRRRWLKLNLYYYMPLFIRPIIYFLYRYFFQFGFLDGRIGFVFHFMHGLWYRCLVDAKILERLINNPNIKN